uniref:Arrestin domain-containing protein 3-like n=1 Tax=Saccoglossus kowalevskii TaxID=10224 RepID=A0ABM0GU37_SACKO|nr:PREDICTED: arrestin domain-containing protein 3-like [Saccoglossus kowalevskii]
MTEYMLRGTMELPERFEFDFDRPTPVYRAGEIVSGRLIVDVASALPLRTLHVVMRGESYVEWEEDDTESGKTEARIIKDKSEIINLKRIIMGRTGADIVANEITEGKHEFPFSFQLPTCKLPTSYEGEYGHVRYWVKAVMDRPWMSKPTTKRCFTVLETHEHNVNRLARKSSETLETTVCSFLCKSDLISLEVSTNKQGYCIGEPIIMCLECKNYSKSNFLETRASLIQRVAYRAHDGNKLRTTYNTLSHKRGDAPQSRGTLRWTNEEIDIPSVPLTTMSDCLIQVSYSLKVTLLGKRTKHVPTLEVILPITIVDKVCQRTRKFSRNSLHSHRLSIPGTPDTKEDNYLNNITDLTTEQFQLSASGECDVRDGQDDKYIMGELTFTPVYPCVVTD